jgi:hypothetical protein
MPTIPRTLAELQAIRLLNGIGPKRVAWFEQEQPAEIDENTHRPVEHPQAHALYADKRNLVIFSDKQMLAALGVPEDVQKSIPHTELVTPENADRLWSERKRLFFKPAAGLEAVQPIAATSRHCAFGKRFYRDNMSRKRWSCRARGSFRKRSSANPEIRFASVRLQRQSAMDSRTFISRAND